MALGHGGHGGGGHHGGGGRGWGGRGGFTYLVDNGDWYAQDVDLQPAGNTISVKCPSSNPFEDSCHISVETQRSGGISGPDARQVSRRIITRDKRLAPVRAGTAQVRQHTAAAVRARGFLPGLGFNVMTDDGSGGGDSSSSDDSSTPAPAAPVATNVPFAQSQYALPPLQAQPAPQPLYNSPQYRSSMAQAQNVPPPPAPASTGPSFASQVTSAVTPIAQSVLAARKAFRDAHGGSTPAAPVGLPAGAGRAGGSLLPYLLGAGALAAVVFLLTRKPAKA